MRCLRPLLAAASFALLLAALDNVVFRYRNRNIIIGANLADADGVGISEEEEEEEDGRIPKVLILTRTRLLLFSKHNYL